MQAGLARVQVLMLLTRKQGELLFVVKNSESLWPVRSPASNQLNTRKCQDAEPGPILAGACFPSLGCGNGSRCEKWF